MDPLEIVTKLAGGNLSAVALLGIVVLLVLFGLLIPKSTHVRELNDANGRANEWRDTAKAQERTIQTQAGTIHTLQATVNVQAESGRTSAVALGTISKTGGEHEAVAS